MHTRIASAFKITLDLDAITVNVKIVFSLHIHFELISEDLHPITREWCFAAVQCAAAFFYPPQIFHSINFDDAIMA